MNNVAPVGPSFDLSQVTADTARALVLRVGDEMTATILNMVGNEALLDTDRGARLLATIQSAEQLQAGQTVQLQVVDTTPEQLTLRLFPSAGGDSEPVDAARILRSLNLSDTPGNRQSVAALVAQGQPITRATVPQLRSIAEGLNATEPQDFRAIAFLMARSLPVTAALVSVVRQGFTGASLVVLADQLREDASRLLRQLPEDSPDPDVAHLRTALEQLVSSSEGDMRDPSQLRQAITELADTLESILAQDVAEQAPGETSTAHPASQLGPQTVAGEAAPEGVEYEPLPGQTQAPASAAPSAEIPSPSGSLDSPNQPVETPPSAPTSAPLPQPPLEEQPSLAPAATNDVPQPQSAPPPSAPLGSPSESSMPAPPPAGDHTAPMPRFDLHPSSTPPAPTTQTAVRQLIPALERASASGSLPEAVRESTVALRDRAQQFVSGVQFQQIQNGTPASSGGPDYLSFPLPLWAGQQSSQGELRLFIQDQAGGRRIDPEDVRIVMHLRMTRLQNLTVNVHVLQRNISCHIDSQDGAVDKVIRAAAPELREQLQGLGYNVAPITCSNLQEVSARRGRTATQLTRVNVKA